MKYFIYLILFTFLFVTNITLTGSAMANWSRDLLIQGVTTAFMVSIHALGHCFGVSASKRGSTVLQTNKIWLRG